MKTLLIVLLILILIGLIVWFWNSQQKKSKDPRNVIEKEIKRLELALESKDLSEIDRMKLTIQLTQAYIDRDRMIINNFGQTIKGITEEQMKKNLEKLEELREKQRKMDEEERKRSEENLEKLRRILRRDK